MCADDLRYSRMLHVTLPKVKTRISIGPYPTELAPSLAFLRVKAGTSGASWRRGDEV